MTGILLKLKQTKKEDYFVSEDFKEVSKRFVWGCVETLLSPEEGCVQIS